MNLKLSDEQKMIRDEVSRYLSEHASREAVRATIEGPALFDDALWRGLAGDMGMAGIPIPEEHGGMGLGMTELVLVLAETGRRLAPVPYFSTVGLASQVLVHAASEMARAQFLPGIAAGETKASVALPALGETDPLAGVAVRAERAGEGYRLRGAVAQVLDLPVADLVIVPAELGGELALFALTPADGYRATALETLDATRPIGRLELEGVTVGAEAQIDDGSPEGLRGALARALAGLAAEQVGAAEGCFALTMAYIAERVQFGRTIASFQAIKHRCAELSVQIGVARSMVLGVAARIDSGARGEAVALEAAAAHAMASEALFCAAAEAIQMHGGVGFTWEYDPHFFFKRAQASAHWFGAPERHHARIGEQLGEGMPVSPEAGDDSAFRRSVAVWMDEKLAGEFAPLRFRGGAGDGDALPELRKRWEQELARGGWTGLGWPVSAGGRGLSVAEQVAFHEEYARAGGPGRMGHVGEGLIGPTIAAFGSAEQKARHLPGILDGTVFWGQGYSEPSAGSDLANVRTKALRDPESGDWIVSGQKIWTSLAHVSDWIFVLARSEEGSVGRNGLIFLLMPIKQEGITIQPIRQINGGAEFNAVFFDNARAKAGDVLGKPGEGWKVAMALLGFERGISTLGQQMGFAQELELVVETARRTGADRDPTIRQRLGRAWAGLRAMRYGALRVLGELEDVGQSKEALGYKYEWSNWHRALGELGMDVLGTAGNIVSGDAETTRLQDLFLFTRAETIYGGSNEIQLNIIAEQGLGMPREPRGTLS